MFARSNKNHHSSSLSSPTKHHHPYHDQSAEMSTRTEKLKTMDRKKATTAMSSGAPTPDEENGRISFDN